MNPKRSQRKQKRKQRRRQLFNKVKSPFKPIHIKMNTYRDKFKEFNQRIDQRLEQRTTATIVTDDTERTCANCGEVYKGRVCPQCGQSGTWMRYSWRQAFLNFLDIWGLGNRPMFRTLRELFIRPGYMVRDYLAGHRNFYFPPFKLLALAVVFWLFARFVTGSSSEGTDLLNSINLEKIHLSPLILYLAQSLIAFVKFMLDNPLYLCLFFAAFGGFCLWITFRKVGKYNFVETYVFLIFVMSQMLICFNMNSIAEVIYKGSEKLIMSITTSGGTAKAAIGYVASILMMIVSFVSSVLEIGVALLLVLDIKVNLILDSRL